MAAMAASLAGALFASVLVAASAAAQDQGSVSVAIAGMPVKLSTVYLIATRPASIKGKYVVRNSWRLWLAASR